MLELQILGSGSATPTLNRLPTAQILKSGEFIFLIDCGEGTQIQLIKHKIKLNKLKHIFISHLHGDHYFGLMGLISSLNLAGRQEPLIIFGPYGLSEIITLQLKHSATTLRFHLDFVPVNCNQSKVIFENLDIKVTTIPLKHRIPCSGFLFEQKTSAYNLNKNLPLADISREEIKLLKSGISVFYDNGSIKYDATKYSFLKHTAKSYAYCSDTAYFEDIIEIVKEVDCLYHEATFTDDLQKRAELTFHSTAREAAIIAYKAQVKQLLLGHFSSRYDNTITHINEAKEVFENVWAVEDGQKFII